MLAAAGLALLLAAGCQVGGRVTVGPREDEASRLVVMEYCEALRAGAYRASFELLDRRTQQRTPFDAYVALRTRLDSSPAGRITKCTLGGMLAPDKGAPESATSVALTMDYENGPPQTLGLQTVVEDGRRKVYFPG